MTFTTALGNMNASMLAAFGQTFTFTHAEGPWTTLSVTGILESGSEVEDVAPGDSSIYCRLWVQSSDFTEAPAVGDEVSSATTVYKIIRMQEDAGGGLWFLLRQDRAVT
jgi:hypothetical protein